MPANIEIKARVQDSDRLTALVEQLAGGPDRVLHQRDTFFRVGHGRLKLRVFHERSGELIYYERVDADGPTRSEYRIHPTDAPETLLRTLDSALGIRGVVSKTRRLYLVGQTRIHLDAVDGLGSFLELEVVLREDQPAAEGERIARDLMRRLEIAEQDLVDRAYIDLLEEGS